MANPPWSRAQAAPERDFSKAAPGAARGRHGEILASFLQSEVQGDLATARAFLDEIAAAERGEKPQPGGVGNAFSIAIAPDGAVIRNAVIEGAAPEALQPRRIAGRARDCGSPRSSARRGAEP